MRTWPQDRLKCTELFVGLMSVTYFSTFTDVRGKFWRLEFIVLWFPSIFKNHLLKVSIKTLIFKHSENCPISFVMKGLQIKATMRCYSIPIKIAKIEKKRK